MLPLVRYNFYVEILLYFVIFEENINFDVDLDA
jgi:hypothetical protein